MNKQIKIYDNVFDTQMLNYADNYIQELAYKPHASAELDVCNFFASDGLWGEHTIINFLKDIITEYHGQPIFQIGRAHV